MARCGDDAWGDQSGRYEVDVRTFSSSSQAARSPPSRPPPTIAISPSPSQSEVTSPSPTRTAESDASSTTAATSQVVTKAALRKVITAPGYNFVFSTFDGSSIRWGKDMDDDPLMAPGPELCDIELSTICHGINGIPCDFCYKSNTARGENMSLDTFKKLFHKLPRTVCQIAFGIGDISGNPDLFSILEYCRSNDYNYVVPNITVNGEGISGFHISQLVRLCGSVAVSRYPNNKENCYATVERLHAEAQRTHARLQINIHVVFSKQTLPLIHELLHDITNDDRLAGKVFAIVLLKVKHRGRASPSRYTHASLEELREIVSIASRAKVRLGVDACGACDFYRMLEETEKLRRPEAEESSPTTTSTSTTEMAPTTRSAEPDRWADIPALEDAVTSFNGCDSMRFSAYINVRCEAFPCSFVEAAWPKEHTMNVLECADFGADIWRSCASHSFRTDLMSTSDIVECWRCKFFDW
ncbi:radical SAM protein [Pelomyxa schiedti]|nr:radical SAM protein [Pelomyxa schiedti]